MISPSNIFPQFYKILNLDQIDGATSPHSLVHYYSTEELQRFFTNNFKDYFQMCPSLCGSSRFHTRLFVTLTVPRSIFEPHDQQEVSVRDREGPG